MFDEPYSVLFFVDILIDIFLACWVRLQKKMKEPCKIYFFIFLKSLTNRSRLIMNIFDSTLVMFNEFIIWNFWNEWLLIDWYIRTAEESVYYSNNRIKCTTYYRKSYSCVIFSMWVLFLIYSWNCYKLFKVKI